MPNLLTQAQDNLRKVLFPATGIITPFGIKKPPAQNMAAANAPKPGDIGGNSSVSTPTPPPMPNRSATVSSLSTNNPPAISNPPSAMGGGTGLSELQKKLIGSYNMSEDEKKARADLDNLIASRRLGEVGITGQAIPMQDITGQLKHLGDIAGVQEANLQERLRRLQDERKMSREGLEKEYEFSQPKTMTVGPKSSVVSYDPVTGQYKTIFSGAGSGGSDTTGTGGFTKSQFNKGATSAGLSTADFGQLDPTVQNYFVNQADTMKTTIDAMLADLADGGDPEEHKAEINSKNIPQALKDYLIGIVDQHAQPAEEKVPWWKTIFQN